MSEQSFTKARAVLEAGVKAMGGLGALQSVTDITREMAGARSDQGQGWQPVPTAQRDQPPVTNPYHKATRVRDLRGQRVMDTAALRDKNCGGAGSDANLAFFRMPIR